MCQLVCLIVGQFEIPLRFLKTCWYKVPFESKNDKNAMIKSG